MASPYYPVRWFVGSPDASGAPVTINGLPVWQVTTGQGFISKAAMFATRVQPAVSGRETLLAKMAYPRWKFSTQWEVIRKRMAKPEWDLLVGFFCQARGQFGRFLYFDRTDNLVNAQPFGVGDGSTRTFQLLRQIGAFSEPVYALNGAPQVTAGGNAASVTVGANGQVIFDTAPASGAQLAWSGSFFYVCRFEVDEWQNNQFGSNQWAGPALKFISLKP